MEEVAVRVRILIPPFRTCASATSVSLDFCIDMYCQIFTGALMITALNFYSVAGALGTRNYAAPEILTGIRNFTDTMSSSVHSMNDSFHKHKRPKKPLVACVSDYGMDADAFSVGATIRHMVTGLSHV